MTLIVGAMVVGPVQFDSPAWLAVGAVLAFVSVLMARRSIAGLGPVARWVSLGARTLLLMLLFATLAEPQLRRVGKDVAILNVLDASQSVPADLQARVDRFLERARELDPNEDDRMGTITVGRTAIVQQLPTKATKLVERQNVGAADATNLASGVRMALALPVEDAARRIVLATDGNETEDSLVRAAEAAKAAGVPIDVLPLRFRYDSEVLVDRLVAPATARQGETMSLRAVIQSTKATSGKLVITLNGQPIDLSGGGAMLGMEVDLKPGSNVFTVPIVAPRHGAQEFRAIFEPRMSGGRPEGDTVLENNVASAVTFVSGEGRVLIISSSEKESAELVDVLNKAGIRTEEVTPEAAPRTLTEWSAFDAVVLVNQPAFNFSQAQQEELKRYVQDAGGGLVMTGGPDSLGAGGWIGSPVEDALPVRLDPPQKRQLPKGALVIITHSVEMPNGVYYGKQTAMAAIAAMSRLDLAGLIEYNPMYSTDWAFPLQVIGDGSDIKRAINNLVFGDMPDFTPVVRLAYNGLVKANAGQKHVIIISDGDPQPPPTSLLQDYVNAKITISTVGVFPHSGMDTRKMSDMSKFTGGRHYVVDTQQALATLPQIFTKEAQTVKRPLIWEGEPFSPTIAGGVLDTLRGVKAVPPVHGYVVAADREGLSQVTLRGKENDAIGAQWQFGLGRSIVFASDVSSRWAGDWISWSGFKSFWEQQIRWAMRPSGSPNVRVTTEVQGAQARIFVDALDAKGERLNFAAFRGRIAMPDGTSQAVEIRQVGPGRYEGVVKNPPPGTSIVGLVYSAPGDNGPIEGSVQAAINRPFADEFRVLEDNFALLEQVRSITGGRLLTDDPTKNDLWSREGLKMPVALRPIWSWLALAAAGVFLIDVGVRRVRVDLLALARSLQRFVSPHKAKESQQIDRLQAARELARQAMASRNDQPVDTQSAGVKFEAEAGAKPASPILDVGRTSEEKPKAGTEPGKDASGKKDATEGMSALLKAKKRARDEMNE
ncbi:MAG: VWA domain-containing protein [Phycisphaeraceae bacterium]|nr:VWA domain-containing protein [Phycisphaeraceae bacterium]